MNRPKTKLDHRVRRHIRIRSKVKGTAECPRLVVYRSLHYTHAQMVDDIVGKVICGTHDMKVKKGTKMERAAVVGKDIGEISLKAGITTCVFDRNGYKYHGRVKAVAEGAREAGLKF